MTFNGLLHSSGMARRAISEEEHINKIFDHAFVAAAMTEEIRRNLVDIDGFGLYQKE